MVYFRNLTGDFTFNTLKMDLGQDYDFYAGGEGAVTFDYRQGSGISRILVKLFDGDTEVASSLWLNPSDYSFHSTSIGLDGDETSVDNIRFMIQNTTSANYYAYFDNIVVTPEPATMGLLGFGAIGLLARRRRR